MKIVAWHPLLTDHQAYTYGAVVPLVDSFRVNVWRTSDAVREAHGWKRLSPILRDEQIVPARGWWLWSREVIDQEKDAWHLFGSPFEDRRQIIVMIMAVMMGRKVGVISEPYSVSRAGYFSARPTLMDRVKFYLRPVCYKAYGAVLGQRLKVVFAISRLACKQFRQMGVPTGRIASFGYFVPSACASVKSTAGPAVLRTVFVGSLIERKGIDVAVEAVRRLRAAGKAVTLDIYGPGDPEAWHETDGVRYRGVIPFGKVASVLARYEALILPSRFDGWGVIGNEAIQVGVPVIASDASGIADVISAGGCGLTFCSGNVGDLERCLRSWIDHPRLRTKAAVAANATALLLEPRVAASYLVRTLEASAAEMPLPASPWYPTFLGADSR